MRIPLPCKLGDLADCKGEILQLKGVSWFKWSWGMEYTYYFATNDFWHDTTFYTTSEENQPYDFEIPDKLLLNRSIKEQGFPLRGKGYAFGIDYVKGNLYIDFIITSNFLEHIRVQCDETGSYRLNGDIIFPVNWDTERKEKAILKSFKPQSIIEVISINSESKTEQMTIFDLLNWLNHEKGESTE